MTAIAGVPSDWGIILAADGRMSLDEHTRKTASREMLSTETEFAQKIFPVLDQTRTVAYALTGSIMSNDFSFDLRDVFRKRSKDLSGNSFDNSDEYIQKFGVLVERTMRSAKYSPMVHRRDDKAWVICEAFFAYCSERSVDLWAVSFVHLNGKYLHEPTRITESFLYGSGVVADSYSVRNLPRNPTFNESRDYAVGYVEACSSEFGRKMDPEGCRSIGGRTHAAAITQNQGFRWLNGYEPVSK